jgi:hypothetical protein
LHLCARVFSSCLCRGGRFTTPPTVMRLYLDLRFTHNLNQKVKAPVLSRGPFCCILVGHGTSGEDAKCGDRG